MFKEIKVWKWISETYAVCFVCFEDMETGKFYVQSADFYRLPLADSQEFEAQKARLLIETPPHLRTEGFDTLPLAIAAHEGEFGL